VGRTGVHAKASGLDPEAIYALVAVAESLLERLLSLVVVARRGRAEQAADLRVVSVALEER
jgi:hypothetical protein